MQAVLFEPHWRRQYSLFQVLAYARRLLNLFRELGCSYDVVRVEGAEGWVTVYSPIGSIKCVVDKVSSMMEDRSPKIQEGIDHLFSSGEQIVSFTRGLKSNDAVTSKQLSDWYKRFFDLLADHALGLFRSFYFVESAEMIFEKALLTNLSSDQVPAAVEQYSRPSRKAHVMKIGEHFAKERDIEKRAVYLREQFPWLFSTDHCSPLPTHQQFVDYASSFQANTGNKDVVGAIKLPAQVLPLVQLYQEMLYIKDKRDEYRRQAFYYISPLVEAICRVFGISRGQLWYVMPHELTQLETQREIFLEEIKGRQSAYVVEIHLDGESITSGRAAKERLTASEETDGVRVIRGKSGFSGVVRGIVQVIRSAGEVGAFEAGRVLVATTTNPDYLPAMQKAVAFVTDEGGITSHAAIVAREMKKPCIVGTKNATKVLHDGDEVEVDATRGTVRLIKRAQ